MKTCSSPWPMWRLLVIGAACALIGILLSCGDDDPVTPPNDNEPPINNQVPAVPQMTDPDTDPPTRSSTISVNRKASDFAPAVSRAYCTWLIEGQGRYETLSGGWVDCWGQWTPILDEGATAYWSDQLPAYHGCFDACGAVTAYCPESGWTLAMPKLPSTARFVFMKADVIDPSPNTAVFSSPETPVCRENVPVLGCISKVHVTNRYQATGQPIEKIPYIRRDRFWVATQWATGALVERTTGDESITLSTSYTVGSSQEETRSFAWSLGAELGLEYKGCKAAVEGSISKTFQSSFTVMEQSTQTVSKTLHGEANKRTCFVMWVLIEQYSWVDADGNPYTDPNYELDQSLYDEEGDTYYAFRVYGTQYEIGKYVFDLTTNQLVSAEFIPVR